MAFSLEIFTAAVVGVGNFNPSIITPDWLEKNNLIGSDDAEAAREHESFLISRQATLLETDKYQLQVLENQFSLTSKGVVTPALEDLAAGIFELIPHTPIEASGINFVGHYKFSSFDEYHAVGDVLAPKKIWKELFPQEEKYAGMASMAVLIQNGTRDNRTDQNETRVSIQRSNKVKPTGISVLINNHRIAPKENRTGNWVRELLREQWQRDLEESKQTMENLMIKIRDSRES